jgi:hypothetical protein
MTNIAMLSEVMKVTVQQEFDFGTTRDWRFIELINHQFVWDRSDADGTATRVGPFASIEECIRDASAHGFNATGLERRKRSR